MRKKTFPFFAAMFVVFIIGSTITAKALINLKGADVLESLISRHSQEPVKVGRVSFHYPGFFKVYNFTWGDCTFREARIYVKGYNPFTSTLHIEKVAFDGLHLNVKRNKDQLGVQPVKKGIQKEIDFSQKNEWIPFVCVFSKLARSNFSMRIDQLQVCNGSGSFVDFTKNEKINLTFNNSSVEIKNFQYPQIGKFHIAINTSVKTPEQEMPDALHAQGWVDYTDRNMNVDISVNKVVYSAFSQYYPFIMQPENLGVKDACFTLNVNLNALRNNLVISGAISVDDVNYEEDQYNENSYRKANFIKRIMTAFKCSDGKPTYQFVLKTKMDQPKLDFSSLKDDFANIVKNGTKIN